MLSLLAKYARDHNLVTEPGFAPKTVKWALCFDGAGRFLDVLGLGDTSEKRNLAESFHAAQTCSRTSLSRGKKPAATSLLTPCRSQRCYSRMKPTRRRTGRRPGRNTPTSLTS